MTCKLLLYRPIITFSIPYHQSLISAANSLQLSCFFSIWCAVHCILFNLISFDIRSQLLPHRLSNCSRQLASSTLSLVGLFRTAGPVNSFFRSSKLMLSRSILGVWACSAWGLAMPASMNLLTSARLRSTCEQAVLRLTMPFLWLVLSRLEIFLVFLPINNQQNLSHRISFYYSYSTNSMTRKFDAQTKHSQGNFLSQHGLEMGEKTQLTMEVLSDIIGRHLRYPFQLLKQFFLFPEQDEESIQVTYKHMRYDMEIAVENIRAVTGLMRQRNLIDGFMTIKNAYNRRLRVQRAYHNIDNLVHFTKVVVTIENMLKVEMEWEGFRKLYENLKRLKLSKISVSKISMISNELPSKQFDDMRLFFAGKGRQIDNSFDLDLSNIQSQQWGHSRNKTKHNTLRRFGREVKENIDSGGKQKMGRKTERKDMNLGIKTKNQNQQKNSIFQEKSPPSECSPIIKQNKLQNKNMIVQRRSGEKHKEGQQSSRVQVKQGENQTQQIFLINNYHSKRKPPSLFIKIPVVSQNVKIVEINTARKKKKQDRIEKDLPFHLQNNSCENCKYCKLMRERRQIMKKVEQKLAFTHRQAGTSLENDNLLSSITFHSKNEHEHGTSPSIQQIPSRIYNRYSRSALNKQYPSTSTNQLSIQSKRLDLTPRHNMLSPPNIWPCEF